MDHAAAAIDWGQRAVLHLRQFMRRRARIAELRRELAQAEHELQINELRARRLRDELQREARLLEEHAANFDHCNERMQPCT